MTAFVLFSKILREITYELLTNEGLTLIALMLVFRWGMGTSGLFLALSFSVRWNLWAWVCRRFGITLWWLALGPLLLKISLLCIRFWKSINPSVIIKTWIKNIIVEGLLPLHPLPSDPSDEVLFWGGIYHSWYVEGLPLYPILPHLLLPLQLDWFFVKDKHFLENYCQLFLKKCFPTTFNWFFMFLSFCIRTSPSRKHWSLFRSEVSQQLSFPPTFCFQKIPDVLYLS